MNRWGIVFVLGGVLATPLLADRGSDESYREIRRSYPYQAGQSIEIDFPTGQLRIEEGAGDSIEVEIEGLCKWSETCGLHKLDVLDRSSSTRIRLKVEAGGTSSKREIRAVLRVPPSADLEVDMSIGELRIEGIEGDLRAELGIGEVDVRAREDRVGSVFVDANIGDAYLSGVRRSVHNRRPLLVGSKVTWRDGIGDSKLDVSVGIGEATVHLD